MTLAATVTELLDLANAGPPTARALHDALASRATAVTHGNANLDTPAWAKGTRGSGDTFLHFTGSLAGIALWEDGRGWGAYAELAVTSGTLADLTPVIGATTAVPRSPGDFHSGNKVSAYIPRGGKTVRVFVELAKGSTDAVTRVTIHFQT